METLPKIKLEDIHNSNNARNFLGIFVHKYDEIVHNAASDGIALFLTESQDTLLVFCFFDKLISNDGFMGLIQRGYGGYIFTNNFAKIIGTWGAERITAIVNKARVLYEKNRNELKKETKIEVINEFKLLDNEYYDIIDMEIEMIKKHIENNISKFATVIN